MEADYIIIYASGKIVPICEICADKHGVHDLAPLHGAKVKKHNGICTIWDKQGHNMVVGPIWRCDSCVTGK